MKKNLLSLVLLVIAFATTNAQITNGLVASYSFDGNANDGSGNGLHASINKGIPAADRFGNPNNAYWFGGDSNTYIQIPHNNKLNLAHSKTISAWYRVDSVVTNWYPSIVYKEGKNVSYPTFGLQFNNDPAYPIKDKYKVGFFFGNGSTNKLISTKEKYADTASFGNWVHIVATYSNINGYQKIYYNGVLSDSILIGNYTSDTSTKPMQIGRSAAANNFLNYFKGYIDDIRLYDRELNSNEVDSLFSEPSPILSVKTINALEETQIYPNPATSQVFISNITDKTTINIFDINGKLCKTAVLNYDINTITIDDLKTGVYTVTLQSNGLTKTHKLLIK